jgi:hypothetical protein
MGRGGDTLNIRNESEIGGRGDNVNKDTERGRNGETEKKRDR